MNQLTNEIEKLRDLLKQKLRISSELPKRDYFDFLMNKLKTENILLIGLRQIGKTTLMEQLAYEYLKNFQQELDENNGSNEEELIARPSKEDSLLYINLKSLSSDQITKTNLIEYISNTNPSLILIDEIQVSDDWANLLQVLIDLNQDKRFIVSGSNARALSDETIIGRIKVCNIKPLSFKEFIKIWHSDKIDKYFNGGTLPGDYRKIDPVLFYKTIVEEQIIDRITLDTNEKIDLTKFKTLSKQLTNFVGNEVKKNTISKDIISTPTVRTYIDVMDKSKLIRKVGKFQDTNMHPLHKIYFEDQTMFKWFKGEDKLNNNDMGAFVENIVFNILDYEFNKNFYDNNIYYFKPKKEIDFIVPSEKIMIEVKFVDNLNLPQLANELNEVLNHEFDDYKKIVICKHDEKIVNGWHFVPLFKLIKGDIHEL